MSFRPIVFVLLASACISGGILVTQVFAQTSSNGSSGIEIINDEIAQRKARSEEINDRIQVFKKQISQKEQEKATLAGELDLLDNRIAKTELDIAYTQEEIKLIDAQLAQLQIQIDAAEASLFQNQERLRSLLQKMQVADKDVFLELLFGSDSVHTVFDSITQLETVSSELKQSLEKTRQEKTYLVLARETDVQKRTQLTVLQTQLESRKQQLDQEVASQLALLAITQRSEQQFKALLEELRQEQLSITFDIQRLQDKIQKALAQQDDQGDASVLSWPVDVDRGISAYFHDPTYPYRHLFEHSGIDIPVRSGTPITSPAPGYIAWTRKGTSYGNYIMVIHPGGLATLYAHLSSFNVKPDQFVRRGDVIGYSGNTGLSTGPHLHFEVRKEGIPTNPLDYLIAR